MTEPRPIRFIHRGQLVQVQGLPPTTTVLSWLREDIRACGTKEGCNEGDCGACTVAVAERDAHGELRLRNVNACLLFLPALDGKALFTVEDLRPTADAPLHPVQQALVEHHGSQCGFCTPGFVMSIWTTCQNAADGRAAPSRQDWADALAGNLCRCTGYRPILDAAEQAAQALSHAPALRDQSALRTQLEQLASDPPLHYRAFDPALGGERRFHAPRSSDELAALLQQQPDCRILGGATDIGLWVNKGHRDVGHLVATQSAHDLNQIIRMPAQLRIGAAVSLEDGWKALAEDWLSLMDLWRRFASPPVRHAGTLSGNVANGSPIGDAPPILMALGAALHLRSGNQRRVVALEDFYLGYQRNALAPGEFIEWIEVPRPAPGRFMKAWKVSKRYDSDISAVCGGFGLTFDGTAAQAHPEGQPAGHPQGPLKAARLAFGGLAATVKRATAAEAALLAHGWSERGIEAACAALQDDFAPMSDHRATAEYRLEMASALLQRLWLSLQDRAPALEIWR